MSNAGSDLGATTSDLVARSHFSTSALSAPDRFDAWQDSISVLYDVAPLDETLDSGFDANIESFMIGSLMAARCRCRVQTFKRTNSTVARDGMDHILVQYYHAGGNVIQNGDGLIKTMPGDIQILDMSQETKLFTHSDGLFPGTRGTPRTYENFSFFIARDRLEQLMPALHLLHRTVLQAGTPQNRILRAYISSLFDNAPAMTQGEAERLVQPTAELFAATVGQAPEVVELAQDTLDQALLLTVKNFIDQHLGFPSLGPDMICKHLGISRTSLFRACRSLGGVATFIRERRLHHARRLLSRPGGRDTVKTIAYRLGFSGPSSFARSFRQQFGFAPSECQELYLAALHSRASIQMTNALPVGDRHYEYWMMNLVA